MYDQIAKEAKGSYGILYLHEDVDYNGHDNEFQVYVLAKGNLTKRKDYYLSPLTICLIV
jgi:hypothetical protein